jgi:signal transduction histidine kinase
MSAHMFVRHQAGRPPLGRALLVLPATAVVTGGACWWAVAEAPAGARALVGMTLGAAAVLVCVAVTAAAYGAQVVRHLRDRIEAMNAEAARLADDMLPVLVKRLRDGASVDTALAEIPEPVDGAHRRILRTLAQEVGKGDRMRAAAMSACANAAGRVQALATSMLADLRDMEHRHDEQVLGDLLKLDHSTAQAGRLADSIAVLTGARSGRRWTKPIVMESVLRGAVGRIGAYQRVRVHSSSTAAVAGYAAEGIMHALAELMDNATSFSPPSEEVHVYVEEAYAGVVITIEDGGLVMSAAALSRAEKAVSSEPLDLTTLSGTRLGLAVVGCLARKHGLTVSFRPSARAGTGVVVMIPPQLITQPGPGSVPDAAPPVSLPASSASSASSAAPREGVAAAESTASAVPVEEREPGGLPKRPRGRTLAATTPSVVSPAAKPAHPPSEAGARFSAFRKAGQGGGASSPQEGPPEDDTH